MIFLLALLVRGIYLYDSSDNPTFSTPIIDSLSYDHAAREAIEGQGITENFFWQQFFYPALLMMVYSFTNSSILCVKLIQIFLGSITCVIIYRLGEKIFGKTAGIASGCIAAFYGPLIFFDGELLAACWATFAAALLILLLIKISEKNSAKLCLVLGLCAGLGVIIRPNFIPFLFLSVIWLIVIWIKQQIHFDKILLCLITITAGFLIIVMPVAAKNYQVTNRFSFLPGTGGVNIYIGNNPDFEATSIRPGDKWIEIMDIPKQHGVKTKNRARQFFYDKTFEYIRTQPINFAKGILHKTTEFLSSREMPGNIDVYLFQEWSNIHRLLTWKIGGFGVPFGILLPLALSGVFFCWRKIPIPIILFVIFYPATIILTHVEARYRMPVVVPMCVLAGAGIVNIKKMIQIGNRRYILIVAAAIVIIGCLCSIAGPFYSEKHLDYEAELYFSLGDSFNKRGQPKKAIEAYSKALVLNPEYAEVHYNIGLLLADEGKLDQAINHYNKALKINYKNANVHADLGLAFYKQAKYNEAIAHYLEALKIGGEKTHTHNHLANALFKSGKVDEAIKHYKRALELKPDDASSHSDLGNVLIMSGKINEAIEHYETSLKIRPGHARTLSNLGNAFLTSGKLQEAEEKYLESLRISNENAPTHYNLGVCLERQGRTDEAIGIYKQALIVNPQYKQAQQALARLSKAQ